jgi:hypothetical protein
MRSNITLSVISLRFLHLYSKSVENLTLSFAATVNGMHLLPRLHLILLVVGCCVFYSKVTLMVPCHHATMNCRQALA